MAGTAVWLGIILGGLILLAFIAGMIKLWFNKKKLKKATEKAHIEAAQKQANREKSKRPVGEGELFGVRAIQNGHFGGVAQSRPASPAPSYRLAPGQTLVDWGKTSSAASSFVDLPRFPDSRSGSPSPLRRQPPDHLSKSIPNVSNGVGGSYLPPVPSPRENRAVSPFLGAEKPLGWVPPLDVHFSRPSTPQQSPAPRPSSFLPKLNFPEQSGKGLFSTPLSSFGPSKSDEAPIITTELSVPPKSTEAPSPSPTASIFPQSRKARQATNAFFTSTADERPSSRKSNKSFHSTKSHVENFPSDLPVPLSNLAPPVTTTTIDPMNFPFDNREWNTGKAVIRDSIVSKHRVSLFRPGADPQDANSRHSRIQSIAASSIYSSRDSMVDTGDQFNLTIPKKPLMSPTAQALATLTNKSPAPSAKQVPSPLANQTPSSSTKQSLPSPTNQPPPRIPPRSRARSRSTSTTSQRSTSTSGKLSRSNDSIRIQRTRTSSRESIRSQNSSRRHSRDRDNLHFDPTSTRRNRSGSIAGRNIDFDHPRESPFSNMNSIDYATSTHSSNQSMSSISTVSARSDMNEMNAQRNMPLPLFDPTHLTVNSPVPNAGPSSGPFKGKGHQSQGSGSDQFRGSTQFRGRDQFESRDRTPSQHSQASIGEVYDSYYRQSMAQRQSVVDQAIERGRQRSASNSSTGSSGGATRPSPLRLGVANDTIVEMPSPEVGAVPERFPKMRLL